MQTLIFKLPSCKTNLACLKVSIFLKPVYSGISEKTNPLQVVDLRQSSSLKQSSSPCWSSGYYSRRLLQKIIEGFDSKINGPALGSALRHSLAGSDGSVRASTNRGPFRVGSSRAGRDRLALGKKATALAILT